LDRGTERDPCETGVRWPEDGEKVMCPGRSRMRPATGQTCPPEVEDWR
jgi:hypothetical protein